jgi:hypothetical protein
MLLGQVVQQDHDARAGKREAHLVGGCFVVALVEDV